MVGKDDLCVHAVPTAEALHPGSEGMYRLQQLDHQLWQQRSKHRPHSATLTQGCDFYWKGKTDRWSQECIELLQARLREATLWF